MKMELRVQVPCHGQVWKAERQMNIFGTEKNDQLYASTLYFAEEVKLCPCREWKAGWLSRYYTA
jgi:hypothetical protein